MSTPGKRDAVVFAVSSDRSFYQRVSSECADFPGNVHPLPTIPALLEKLSELQKINLAFVLLVEREGRNIDTPGLRKLRLDYPQVVIVAVLEQYDQQIGLRLQSIGVHGILLPPFEDVSITREVTSAIPNVPQFKRHPDLMRRAQARFDFLIPSELSYVLGINYEISLLLKEFGFSQQDSRVNIPLACDEAITNAIIHGNNSQPEKKVNIQIYVSKSRFRIRVRDQGNGFNFADVADPREGENVHRGSGRGIFLMKNIMDKVEYKEGGCVLELEKKNSEAGRSGGEQA
jgi:serine/threonine-protein kinase RsbW